MPELLRLLQEALQNRPTSIDEVIQITKELGHEISNTTAHHYLYRLSYVPSKNNTKWKHDKDAKRKKLSASLSSLKDSQTCNEEQTFLIEVTCNNHATYESIASAMRARGVNISDVYPQYLANQYGVSKNSNGFFKVDDITEEQTTILFECKDKDYVSFSKLLEVELNQKSTTVNKVVEISKKLGDKLGSKAAIRYLYELNYTPSKKAGEWVHDVHAKARRLEVAIKSLSGSDVCDNDQGFLLEVINNQHSSRESILDAMLQNGFEVSEDTIKYAIFKFGITKNSSGYYIAPGISEEVVRLANQNRNQKSYLLNDFIIDYAMQNEGACNIQKILDVLEGEGFQGYHEASVKKVKALLSKNGFILDGPGFQLTQTIYHRPNHCFDLIEQAYKDFYFGIEHYNNHAVILYYVACENINKTNLMKMLNTRHGISPAYAEISINALRLVNTNEGLRFPEGSNEESRISREAFYQMVENKQPKSVADKIYEMFNQGKSAQLIQNQLNVNLTISEIEKLYDRKQKCGVLDNQANASQSAFNNDVQWTEIKTYTPIEIALKSLENSQLCNAEQLFLLTVINFRHPKYQTIQTVLSEKGIDVTLQTISSYAKKYNVKFSAGFYGIEGLSSELRDIAKKHGRRKYYSIEKLIIDHVKENDGQLKISDIETFLKNDEGIEQYHTIDRMTIKSLLVKNGCVLEPGGAMRDGYKIFYRPHHCLDLIATEYNVLLQGEETESHYSIILYYVANHHMQKSQLKKLLKEVHGISNSKAEKVINELGLVKTKNGLDFPEGSNEAGRISREMFRDVSNKANQKNLQSEQHVNLNGATGILPETNLEAENHDENQTIQTVLNNRSTTVNEVIRIAKETFGQKISQTKAKNLLYSYDYAPDGHSGRWKHDIHAKKNRLMIAMKSLEKSRICDSEQGFLLEIINYAHTMHKTIQQAISQKGFNVTTPTIRYYIVKYGVIKNTAGHYKIGNIPDEVVQIAYQNRMREHYSLNDFIIDYAMKHSGLCTIKAIMLAISKENFQSYHVAQHRKIKELLVRNGFVLNGTGEIIDLTVSYEPNHSLDLIQRSYNRLLPTENPFDLNTAILYYVAHNDINMESLIMLMKAKHGISQHYVERTIQKLGLVSTKEGLRFPEGSNAEDRISREIFYEATQNLKFDASHKKQKSQKKKDTDGSSSSSTDTVQNSIETDVQVNMDRLKRIPVTPEERLAQHNKKLHKQYQQKANNLRQQYISQQVYIPLFEQLYLNHQVHAQAQQNMQANIIQMRPAVSRQLAATGTDGFAVSSHSAASRRNRMAPIYQMPTKSPNTKPSLPKLRSFAHPTGMMIGGMYVSRVIAYKATKNAKFADRMSEFSAYPIAASLLYCYANNVGVKGGFVASTRAALYYGATKLPPVAAATAVATIIATPFVQLKKYADMANYSAKVQRETIINSVLFQSKQDPDYFANNFYSHDEREDLFKERYGVFSLEKTELQISRDQAFMDYELSDIAISTMTTALDMKADEKQKKKRDVLQSIRSSALSFLKATYPNAEPNRMSFGAFDRFK